MTTKISLYQLFAGMVLSEYGNASLYFLAADAKQDAWLALLLYIPVGMILQLLYTELYYNYPNDTLITYLPKIFGRLTGSLLGFTYIVYFTYIAARLLRSYSELILIASLPDMSILVVTITSMIVFSYGAFAGIENISRAAEIILPLLIFGMFVLFILLYATPNVVKFHNVKPFLENGLTSVLKAGWRLYSFPYGETIIFAMIYSSVNTPAKVRTTSLLAILFLGIGLSLNTIAFLVSLGVTGASSSLFPLFEALRLIKLGFLDKLDIFIILIMIIGAFFKISIFTYGAILGTSQLIKLKDPKYLTIPFGIGIAIWSIFMAKNYPQHIQVGFEFTPLYIYPPFLIVVPPVALLVHYLKKHKKGWRAKSSTP